MKDQLISIVTTLAISYFLVSGLVLPVATMSWFQERSANVAERAQPYIESSKIQAQRQKEAIDRCISLGGVQFIDDERLVDCKFPKGEYAIQK